MNVKGIVRRLDDLGRVVIPREYRKAYGIELGDPMEIFALDNGDIVVRRLDVGAELVRLGALTVQTLAPLLSGTVAVSDLQSFVVCSGSNKSEIDGKYVPRELQKRIADRRGGEQTLERGSEASFGGKFSFVAYEPVMKEDLFGGLFLFSDGKAGSEAVAALKLAAALLGNSLQKY